MMNPCFTLSALYAANAGHRGMIQPTPRVVSSTAHLAAIRQLETAGVLTAFEAARARARINTNVARVGRKEA